MSNKLTKDNLVENMFVKLQAFNDEKVTLNLATVHKEVVNNDPGIGGRPSYAALYQWGVMATIDKAGARNEEWPTNWLDLSINDLADYIISKQPS